MTKQPSMHPNHMPDTGIWDILVHSYEVVPSVIMNIASLPVNRADEMEAATQMIGQPYDRNQKLLR